MRACECMHVCECLALRLLITSSMMWCDMSQKLIDMFLFQKPGVENIILCIIAINGERFAGLNFVDSTQWSFTQ